MGERTNSAVHPDKGMLLGLKKKGHSILSPATAGTSPEDTVLSDIGQTQDKYCVIPLTGGPQRSQTHRQKAVGGCQGISV